MARCARLESNYNTKSNSNSKSKSKSKYSWATQFLRVPWILGSNFRPGFFNFQDFSYFHIFVFSYFRILGSNFKPRFFNFQDFTVFFVFRFFLFFSIFQFSRFLAYFVFRFFGLSVFQTWNFPVFNFKDFAL